MCVRECVCALVFVYVGKEEERVCVRECVHNSVCVCVCACVREIDRGRRGQNGKASGRGRARERWYALVCVYVCV